MIELLELESLKDSRNLLAFSAGIDSTALLFLLRDFEVEVDLALVNYGVREQSREEELYARELSEELNIKIYIKKAPLWSSNFEKEARDFRYSFFEEIIKDGDYKNLITAHHLGDRLEWFFMRFIRGAGTVELSGMRSSSQRFIDKNRSYNLIRPLLNSTKDELQNYLEKNGIKYFIDQSNFDTTIERNQIRATLSEPLLKSYRDGIERSFEYLSKDRDLILECFTLEFREKDLAVFRLKSIQCASRASDIFLKSKGVLMSAKEREQLILKKSTLISRDWVAEVSRDLLFIAPFIQGVKLPKREKEIYRLAKVPPKVRAYIFQENIRADF